MAQEPVEGGSMSDEKLSLKEKLTAFFKPKDDIDFEDEQKHELNEEVNKRNSFLLLCLIAVLGAACLGYLYFTLTDNSKMGSEYHRKEKVEFGTVVDSQFATEDAQSAEKYNADEITQLKDGYKTLNDAFGKLTKKLSDETEKRGVLQDLVEKLQKQKEDLKTQLDVAVDMMGKSTNKTDDSGSPDLSDPNNPFSSSTGSNTPASNPNPGGDWRNNNGGYISENSSPRYVDEPDIEESHNSQRHYVSAQMGTPTASIDSFDFATAKDTSFTPNAKNYVSSGSWVTAVLVGGAEANAGVSGESNTSPVLFETLNDGFLPNGKKSTLKGCHMTGSAHGDISSQRGIVRGDRFSCIRPDGSVLDIPVEATVFNYGKNGIRGEAIMRNSKIVQSVGLSSVLSGLGNAASTVSSTNSVSALGSTSTVNAGDVGLNLLGNVGSETGNKLGDYWLKLAEKYHPDIDLRQGSIVNIVFLKGFPLEGDEVNTYTKAVEKSRSDEKMGGTSLMSMTTNPLQVMAQNAKNAASNIGSKGGNDDF